MGKSDEILKNKHLLEYLEENSKDIVEWLDKREKETKIKENKTIRDKKISKIQNANKKLMKVLYPDIPEFIWDKVETKMVKEDFTFSIHKDPNKYYVIKAKKNLDESIKKSKQYDWLDVLIVKNGRLTYINKFLESMEEKVNIPKVYQLSKRDMKRKELEKELKEIRKDSNKNILPEKVNPIVYKPKEKPLTEQYPDVPPFIWDYFGVRILPKDKNFSVHKKNNEFILIKSDSALDLNYDIREQRQYDWADFLIIKDGKISYINKFLK